MKYLNYLSAIGHYLPYIGAVALGLALVVLVVRGALRLISWRWLLSRRTVFIELTPPAFASRTANATAQLFSVIHGQRAARPFKHKLLRRDVVVSLEMVSTRKEGVRYIIRVEAHLADSIQQAITSYLPDAKVAIVSDYLANSSKNHQIIFFKQTGHYSFPLATQAMLDQHDPVAYLAGAMSKLAPSELMGIQFVLTPVKLREAYSLSQKILVNEDILSQLKNSHSKILRKLMYGINSLLLGSLDAIGSATHPTSRPDYSAAQRNLRDRQQVAKRLKPARQLSTFEQKLIESMHQKVSQPLFRVSIRALVAIDDRATANERLGAIKSSLASYSVPSYQALKPTMRLPFMARFR